MLLFTPQQSDYVLNTRRAFHASEAILFERQPIANASPLPKDVWGVWDKESVQVQKDVLSVFNDLAASVSMPMPLGKLVHHFRTVSDMGEATVSIDGKYKGKTDQQNYNYHGTPLPIIADAFSYGWRQYLAAQTEGMSLDSDGRLAADRNVAEKLESIALSGDSAIVVNGSQLYGLLNHPNRNTRTTGQALNGATGAQWTADVNATLKLNHAKNYRVPMTLYVNWDDWYYAQNTDYSAAYPNKTIAQRVLEMGGVEKVVPASKVPAGTIVAVVKRSEVVRVLNGLPISTRPRFRANVEDDYEFMVMAAASVEIKFDAENQCGIAVSSL